MTPRLTIGLPVYNGERYLQHALDTLLRQTFSDFELIISDNGSTDRTADICQHAAADDERVRYVRQDRNIGSAANHDAVAHLARGSLFKWASDDDLYAPELLERCVAALDGDPRLVAAHAWTALTDEEGTIVSRFRYGLETASSSAPERFRSVLFDVGGDDDYAVIRTEVLRALLPYGSHYRSDRTITAALALHGPIHQVPDWLYLRREHPDRASRTGTVRSWCSVMDPRRADRWRHPTARLIAEYAGAFVTAIRQAPLSADDRLRCYRWLAVWMASRSHPQRWRRQPDPSPETVPAPPEKPTDLLSGRTA